MSTATLPAALRRTAPQTLATLRDALVTLLALALRPVRALAFWLAALLPFAYLPAFGAGILTDPTLFVGSLVLNAAALVCGHGHGRR